MRDRGRPEDMAGLGSDGGAEPTADGGGRDPGGVALSLLKALGAADGPDGAGASAGPDLARVQILCSALKHSKGSGG